MPSIIYSDNLKNPENGDLRQWRLFAEDGKINLLNILSLFSTFIVKNILFLINSIGCYSKTPAILKDSRFLLTNTY